MQIKSMILPVPLIFKNKYSEVNSLRPKAKTLAQIYDYLEKTEDYYQTLHKFLAACITSISGENNTVTNPDNIREMIGGMAYKTAEFIAIEIAKDLHDNDYIEGVYTCNFCGHQNREQAEIEGEENYSCTKLSELPVNTTEENFFSHELRYPIKINTKDEPEIEINELSFYYPTLKHCKKASEKQSGTAYMQMQIFAEALRKLNSQDVDNKFISRYGFLIMSELDPVDLDKIYEFNRNIGRQTTIKKTCKKCGSEFKASIRTNNFFASTLHTKL